MNTLRPRITSRILCTCLASIHQKLPGLSGFCNSVFYRENQRVLTPRILSRWTKKESRSHEYDSCNEDWRKETKRIILRLIFPESHDVGELGIDPELFEVAGEAALSAFLRSFIFFPSSSRFLELFYKFLSSTISRHGFLRHLSALDDSSSSMYMTSSN